MKKPEGVGSDVRVRRLRFSWAYNSSVAELLQQQVRSAFPVRQAMTLTIRDEALEEWRLVYEKA